MSSALLILAAVVSAGDPGKTSIDVELLAPPGRMVLESQRWARRFKDLGLSVRIRSRRADDKPDLTEKVRGRLRFVKLVGELKADGSIAFPGNKVFQPDSTAALATWIRGIKVYGAAGAPDGQAGWGLTPAGHRELGTLMARTPVRPSALAARDVVASLSSVTGLQTRFDPSAAEYATDICQWPEASLAVGTVTAAALESVGLGFAPVRLPSGATELLIQPQDDQTTWPVGWVIPAGTPPAGVVPPLFALAELSRETQSLPDFLANVTSKTGVEIVTLRGELDAQLPKWKTIDIAGNTRPIQPILPLAKTLRIQRMSKEYRLDDKGAPFLLIRVHDMRRTPNNAVSPTPQVASLLQRMAPSE